jgi:hypothetical protein
MARSARAIYLVYADPFATWAATLLKQSEDVIAWVEFEPKRRSADTCLTKGRAAMGAVSLASPVFIFLSSNRACSHCFFRKLPFFDSSYRKQVELKFPPNAAAATEAGFGSTQPHQTSCMMRCHFQDGTIGVETIGA